MMRATPPLFLCLVAFAPIRVAGANAWTREQGSFYGNLGYSRISADGFYRPDFERQGLRSTYTQHTLGFYGETGVIDRWLTIIADATLYRRSGLADQGYAHGLGDMRLGAWSGLLTHPARLSVGMILGLPTGDPLPDADDDTAQGIANSLPTGDGEFDVELAAAAGHGFGAGDTFWPLEHYGLLRLGYWLRTTPREVPVGEATGFSDAFNWHTEIGTRAPYALFERLWFIVRVYGSESFSKGMEGFSGLGDGVTHRSLALQLYVRLWRKLGLSGSRASAFSARNLPAAAQYTVALSYER